ncbi:MAG: hypothetical protein ABFD46_01585 [Armatimonadota bacterium]
MRHTGLVILAVLCLVSYAAAEEPAQPVQPAPRTANLTPVMKAGEQLRYKVKVKATGSTMLANSSKPVSIDTVVDLVISVSVGELASDGSTQVSIAAQDASAVIDGQRLVLPTSIFPKTTALIDKNGEIKQLLTSDSGEVKMPGINSKNLILLFRPNAPAGDVSVGSTWKKTISLPPEPEKYGFVCKFESIENINGKDTAKVRTDLTVLPPSGADYSSKGFVVTNYSLDGCKLMKSHAEMTVKMNNNGYQKDTPEKVEANIGMDVEPLTADSPAK